MRSVSSASKRGIKPGKERSLFTPCRMISFVMLSISLLWLWYLCTYVPNFQERVIEAEKSVINGAVELEHQIVNEFAHLEEEIFHHDTESIQHGIHSEEQVHIQSEHSVPSSSSLSSHLSEPAINHQIVTAAATTLKPVLGEVPTHGAKPLYGIQHKGGDAIFALAANYPKLYYQRFVGSLRKIGYDDDIVLAVSIPEKMKPGVGNYLESEKVVAYGFDVECQGKDNCKFVDNFLGYPDPRPYRTFANIRYAVYEYWMHFYNPQSYILILDFRDTFFQANPFASFGPLHARTPKYELQLFEENFQVSRCITYTIYTTSVLFFRYMIGFRFGFVIN
jgi:hypothetical protein